jgi:hypothetical protein
MLVRNPADAWKSFRSHLPTLWWRSYPHEPVGTLKAFAHHWAKTAIGFREIQRLHPDQSLIIRYEDISSGDVDGISDFLGMQVDRSVVDEHIGGSKVIGSRLNAFERATLRRHAGEATRSFGYDL